MIHEDLSLNTYKKIRVRTLTANQIQRRNSFVHWIKNRFSREKCDEKWFDQYDLYNRQNDCVYAESREAANKDLAQDLYTSHGIGWNHFSRSYQHRYLPQKSSFDAVFYVKNVLPIVKRDGNILIGSDCTFQQDGA